MKRININLLLALLVIILVNVVGQRAYLRFDLTARNVYSLSPVSEELVATLDNPLRVHVFYSDDVPAQYGTVRQYLLDILNEYDAAAERNFTYRVYSMGSQSDRQAASEFGVSPIQIREVRQDEFQQSQAYMGVALAYGDRIEVVNELTQTQGLEYKLTSTMQSMVSAVDALAGISGQVQMDVYASENLEQIGIQGLEELEQTMSSVHETLNEQNAGKLAFNFNRPTSASRIEELASRFGLQRLTWQPRDGGSEQVGVLGVVLRHNDESEPVPIQIRQTLTGYQIESADSIQSRLENSLTVLVQANPSLAYVTGHGEKSLSDPRRGAGQLRGLLEERYQIQQVDLSSDQIPEGTQTVIINGPRENFSDWELYQLDQFLLRGGSVLALVDPFRQVGGQRRRPQYLPINTGLGEMLSHYGISPQQNYAMDTESYTARQQNRQDVQVYNAPLVQRDRLSRTNAITAGLNQVLFLNSSSLAYPDGQGGGSGSGAAQEDSRGGGDAVTAQEGVEYTRLAHTSEDGWLMTENITLNPRMLRPPRDQQRGSATLAVVARGTFTSYFDEPVSPPASDEEGQDGGQAAAGQDGSQQPGQAAAGDGQGPDGAQPGADADGQGTPEEAGAETVGPEGGGPSQLAAQAYIADGTSAGRLLVAGTSELAGAQLLGRGQQTPNTIFLQNMVDWLNGNEEIPPMRTKGLGASQLDEVPQATRTLTRMLHVVIIPALTVVAGLLVWARRRQLRRSIERRLQPGGEA